MKPEIPKDAYQVAYDEAASHLKEILASVQELCNQKQQVEKLLKVLKPQVETAVETEALPSGTKRTTQLPNCTVITRLTLL